MLKYLLLNFFYYHKTSKTHLPSTWPLLCTFNHQAMRKSVQPTRRHDSAKIWCSTSRELSLVCARCRFPTKASQTPGDSEKSERDGGHRLRPGSSQKCHVRCQEARRRPRLGRRRAAITCKQGQGSAPISQLALCSDESQVGPLIN